MGIFALLVVIVVIEKSNSQMLSTSKNCFSTGDSLTLHCKTTDFTEVINFNLNTGSQGSCIPTIPCDTGLSQSGTTTSITFTSFNELTHGGNWTCTYGSATSAVLILAETHCPISQMSTSIATERTPSVNSIFEFGNITIPMITGTAAPTSDISVTTSNLNKESENSNEHTESTNFYSNAESTNFYSNTESTNLYSNTESVNFYSTAESTNFNSKTESTNFYSNITTVNEFIETTTFYANTETTNIDDSSKFNEIQTKTSTESLLLSISGNSSCFQQINSNAKSSLISTSVIDQSFYSSKMEDPSFTYNQYLSESSVTLQIINVISQLPSAIIDTINFLYTTNTLITTYYDDTSILFGDFTDSYQTFSHGYAASTSLNILYNSTDHHLSLQTTEYNYESMQTELTSYVISPLYESHTDNAATGMYFKEIVTSGKSYMHTSVMPSQTQLASMNDIQDSTVDFQPTYFETYSQSNHDVFSSEISEHLFSTLQSTNLFILPFNSKENASAVDSYIKSTNLLTFGSQSGIRTTDLSVFTNPSSIQITTVLLDFKTILLTTTINFNSKTLPSMIKPSSKQTSNGISYNEIETPFKESLFSLDTFSGYLTSNDKDMTSLSSGVSKPMSTVSTNTIQSGLSEKSKTIIFIITTAAVITTIVVILLIIFSKVYMSKNKKKPRTEDDNISWSKKSIPAKAAFSDYSFNGKIIYPLLNTSSMSFKMYPYEQRWNDIV